MLFDNFDFSFLNEKNESKKINDEGYIYGNMFTDEYAPYKNYPVYILKASDEKNKLLLKVMEESFIINDLNLYLDVNPKDNEIFQIYKKHAKLLQNLEGEYESKYGPLCSDKVGNSFDWINSPWPWEGYNV